MIRPVINLYYTVILPVVLSTCVRSLHPEVLLKCICSRGMLVAAGRAVCMLEVEAANSLSTSHNYINASAPSFTVTRTTWNCKQQTTRLKYNQQNNKAYDHHTSHDHQHQS